MSDDLAGGVGTRTDVSARWPVAAFDSRWLARIIPIDASREPGYGMIRYHKTQARARARYRIVGRLSSGFFRLAADGSRPSAVANFATRRENLVFLRRRRLRQPQIML